LQGTSGKSIASHPSLQAAGTKSFAVVVSAWTLVSVLHDQALWAVVTSYSCCDDSLFVAADEVKKLQRPILIFKNIIFLATNVETRGGAGSSIFPAVLLIYVPQK